MKLFACDGCGNLVYFENTRCLACGRALGYDADGREILALEPEPDGAFRPTRGGGRLRLCANATYDACNWLLAEEDPDPYCRCCRHNRTVPDLTLPENLVLWRRIEAAKHRLVDTLNALGLPLPTKAEEPETGLAFDVLDAEGPAPDGNGPVMTGHAEGLVTLALHEADDAVRERIRTELGEPYRSLLGHFRHEVGHYYFDRIVRLHPTRQSAFRALMGDESQDYTEALKRHYAEGPPADWQETHVSAYATAHPWEDFAETFAHYLHIVDTLETARSFGISVRPRVAGGDAAAARLDIDPLRAPSIEIMIDRWLPLTYAVNSLNRSMGIPDLYPFVLAPTVIAKLGLIHDFIVETRR